MNALLTWVGSDPSRSIIIDAPVTLLALAIFITICLCIKRTILMIRIHKLLIKKIAWNHWFVKFLFRNDIDDALNDFRFKMGMKIITSVPKETQKEVETTANRLKAEIDEVTSVQKRANRERIESRWDRPYWLWWKIYHFIEDKTFPLSPLSPRNTRKRLRVQLKALLSLEKRCREFVASVYKLEEEYIPVAAEEEKRIEEERKALEKEISLRGRQKTLDRLEREIPELLATIFHKWKSSTHNSSCLDFGKAEETWKSMFISLQEKKDKGEGSLDQIIEDFLSFGQNFTPPDHGEPVPVVELQAEQIINAEKRLHSIKEILHELETEIHRQIKVPEILVEADKIIKYELPQAWMQLDKDFQRLLDGVDETLIRLGKVMEEAQREGQIIIAWKQDIGRIVKLEEIATSKIYKIKIEHNSNWARVINFLDKRALDLWSNLDLSTLVRESAEIPVALRMRQQTLIKRVESRLNEVELDLSAPQEIVEGLKKLLATVRGNQESGSIAVSGEVFISPEGTSMPAGYEKSWLGESN